MDLWSALRDHYYYVVMLNLVHLGFHQDFHEQSYVLICLVSIGSHKV
jgi:hypothetical protein